MQKFYSAIMITMLLVLQLQVFPQQEKIIRIETTYGDIQIKLYNETPLHRDNFIKLAEQGYFDSLLFHRVINEFMIQGGDPESRHAEPGARLGNGGPGYKIPAEFNPSLYHKKGALAAAREGDQVNPEKASSGSQFYIVQGKVFPDSVLSLMEEKMNERNKQTFIGNFVQKPENSAFKERMIRAQQARDSDAFAIIIQEVEEAAKDELIKLETFRFSGVQRKTYSSVGGTPHLDGAYTVFGEVIHGLEVVDKIAQTQTDNNDRPLEDILMKVSVIK